MSEFIGVTDLDDEYRERLRAAWKDSNNNNGLQVQIQSAKILANVANRIMNELAGDQPEDIWKTCAIEAAALHLGMTIAGLTPDGKDPLDVLKSVLPLIEAIIPVVKDDFLEFQSEIAVKH